MENRVTGLLIVFFVALVFLASAMTVKKYIFESNLTFQVQQYEQTAQNLEQNLQKIEQEKKNF
ncbi:MAG: hypothetical protein WD187_04300 [Candidatus Woykebacteria bacterium]